MTVALDSLVSLEAIRAAAERIAGMAVKDAAGARGFPRRERPGHPIDLAQS